MNKKYPTGVVTGKVVSVDINNELLEALKETVCTLKILAEHHAFSDDATEFNRHGIGYVAIRTATAAIAKAEGKTS